MLVDLKEDFQVIWNALHGYREDCISQDDEEWDKICAAMARLHEERNIKQEDID
jgi:hypothetical protein|tara:strand:+ start:1038 stop:1199 length:162 start_codon:yes stop_codon:yes gene_type:complete